MTHPPEAHLVGDDAPPALVKDAAVVKSPKSIAFPSVAIVIYSILHQIWDGLPPPAIRPLMEFDATTEPPYALS